MSNKTNWGDIGVMIIVAIVGGSIAIVTLVANLFYVAEQWAGWGKFFFGE